MIKKIITVLLNLMVKLHISIPMKSQLIITQFIKFSIIGITNVVISYLINIITLLILTPYKISWDYIIGNFFSFFLSVLWSFYWNNQFVFKQEDDTKKRHLIKPLLKTYISYSFSCVFLNNIFSWFFIETIGVSKFVSPLLVSCITIPVNFILNKFWAFKNFKD